MNYHIRILACLLLAIAAPATAQISREQAVRQDKALLEADASWIYNDFRQGMGVAKASGAPLLVLIRCLP